MALSGAPGLIADAELLDGVVGVAAFEVVVFEDLDPGANGVK
jgi:hypothetical protein